MTTPEYTGPIDFAVITLPADASLGEGMRLLFQQAARGAISLLDVEIIGAHDDGTVGPLPAESLRTDGEFDVRLLDGARSDILEDDDLAAVAEELPAGQVAIVIVYEDRSLAPAALAWESVGGSELWSGGIDVDDLQHSLDHTAGENATTDHTTKESS